MDRSSQRSKSNNNSNGDSARSFASDRNIGARRDASARPTSTARMSCPMGLMTDEEISRLDPEIARQLNFNLFGRTWEQTLADFPKVNTPSNRRRRGNERYQLPLTFEEPDTTAYGNSSQDGSANYGPQVHTSSQNSNGDVQNFQNSPTDSSSADHNENDGISNQGPTTSEGNGDMGQQQQSPASKSSDARNEK